MNTTQVTRLEAPPSTVAPMSLLGVDYGRVDPTTRHIIHKLFPAPTRGHACYLGLLANARVISATLPCNPLESRGDAAVVCVTGYAALSERVGLSYDTTHMYLLIYRALGLLYIEKHDGLTMIIMPLGVYHPPVGLAETLLQLRERYRSRRPKIGRLISKIIERIAALIQIDSEQESCNLTMLLQHDHPQVYTELLTRIQKEVSGQRVVIRETAQARADGRFLVSNLPTTPINGESTQSSALQIPTHAVQCGRFDAKNLPTPRQTGEVIGNTFAEQGRFDAENLLADLQLGEAPQAAPELTSKNLPTKVESEILLLNGNGGNGRKNINNILLPNPDPVPVKAADGKRQQSPMHRRLAHGSLINQAKTLAKLVEGNEKNVGAYIVLIKQHHLQTLRAAVIATLLRKHWPQERGALRKPGGYYTRQVQEFQHAIPEPILTPLHTYEQASYEEIDAALATQAHLQVARQEPPTFARQTAIRPKRGTPMSKATAEALALRIPQVDSFVQVRGLCEEEGIYALRVYIAPVEHLFASVEDWECYHAQMRLLEQEESA